GVAVLHAIALAVGAVACNERVRPVIKLRKFAVHRVRFVYDLLRTVGVRLDCLRSCWIVEGNAPCLLDTIMRFSPLAPLNVADMGGRIEQELHAWCGKRLGILGWHKLRCDRPARVEPMEGDLDGA